MRAGTLRHRLSIESVALAADGYSGTDETWTQITGGAVWGQIKPLSGRELSIAHQTQPMTTHEVTIRYLSTVTSAMRIKFGTRVFKILSILNEDERKISLKILCEEFPS